MDQRRHVRPLVALVGSQIVLVTALTGMFGRDASDFASEIVRVETVGDADEADAVGDDGRRRESPAALPAIRDLGSMVEYVPERADLGPSAAPAPASSSVPTTSPPTTIPPTTAPPTTGPGPSGEEPAGETAVGEERTATTGIPGVGDGLVSGQGPKPVDEAQAGGVAASSESSASTSASTTLPASTTGSTTSSQSTSAVASTTAPSRATTTSGSTTTAPSTAGDTTPSGSTTTLAASSQGQTSASGRTSTAPDSSTSTSTPPTANPTSTAPTSTPPASSSSSQPTTTESRVPDGSPNAGLEALRNHDSRFGRYADVASADLDLMALTEPALVRDNGTVGDGQFRAACQYSHFAYDDPIVFPGQSGRSHLHMFFGNTTVDADTTTSSLVDSGGSTCNGFELNRSGYWTPALLDGRGNAVVPEMIVLYYKTKQPDRVERMPQGLKMIAGNTTAETFSASQVLFWSCGDSGGAYNVGNRIPDCEGDTFNATIVFPQCWDGRNLDSGDHRSHMAMVSPHADCPSSHPVRLPQISILLYFPGQESVDGWHLSSDRSGGFNTGPGATLHADWWGGWNDDAMDLWIDGCMKAARNCSFGQTGTDRVLAKLNAFQNYAGPYILPLP